MTIAPGARLGPYEVLSLIGAGGMGEVYKARDTRLDRTVAIKLLPADLADRPDRRRRFEPKPAPSRRSAIRTSARSSTSASRTAVAFLVMEFLEGETLDDG